MKSKRASLRTKWGQAVDSFKRLTMIKMMAKEGLLGRGYWRGLDVILGLLRDESEEKRVRAS